MPELPDITVYIESLEERIVGRVLEMVRLASPFLVRSAVPSVSEAQGKSVHALRRLGKRIVFALEDDLFLIFHLMISGRFRWRTKGAKIPGRLGLAAFDFSSGTLLLTEASKKKRASLHVARGEEALAAFDPGGMDVLGGAGLAAFQKRLLSENHTLKRALTDPRLFSGIGNAYSDEILHRARLSPVKLTQRLEEDEIRALFLATQSVLSEWTDRLRDQTGEDFPEKVTAFREGMAVHGRYKKSCPDCGAPVQRIRYAENECNYCASCQNAGRLLADRGLSRLLKKNWPRTLEELEERRKPRP